jgi:subfamily B ATP-binding cassette protein MsbA
MKLWKEAIVSPKAKDIQRAIEELIKDRTAIIIAHRLSTIRRADKILVLQQGVIKEEGTHQELLGLPDGIYAQLYEASFKEV